MDKCSLYRILHTIVSSRLLLNIREVASRGNAQQTTIDINLSKMSFARPPIAISSNVISEGEQPEQGSGTSRN
jgi:hypothetical protein